MKIVYIDESGETCFRPKDRNQIFGLGSLLVEDDKSVENLFEKITPYLINGELKYENYKNDISTYNTIINIINNSEIKYHLELVQPITYYYTLLVDYLFFPYWIYISDSDKAIKKEFFYTYEDILFTIDLNLIHDFFIIESIEEYCEKAFCILNSIKMYIPKEAKLIFDGVFSNIEMTKQMFFSEKVQIQNIKPIPDLVGNKQKNKDVFFLSHLQCLYNIIKRYQPQNIIHDENFRLHDYILQDIQKNFPSTCLEFKDSKTEKGLVIIDCIVSYYTHALIDINLNKNRGFVFYPKSYNMILNKNLLAKATSEQKRIEQEVWQLAVLEKSLGE